MNAFTLIRASPGASAHPSVSVAHDHVTGFTSSSGVFRGAGDTRQNGTMADAGRFAAAMTAATRRLPFGLSRVVAPSVVGYVLINLCTFCIDLGLLAVFHGGLHWPVPLAVTLSYGTATMVSYAANRVLNFRSHGSLGRQLPLYLGIVASNYLMFVLGVTSGLSAAGVYYELARVIAATCEGVYLYCCMRWIVFRDTMGAASRRQAAATEDARQAPGAPEPSSPSAVRPPKAAPR